MKKLSVQEIEKKADTIRKEIIDVAVANGAGHIAPSLSIVDVLAVLYYNIMNISSNPQWAQRDRLVFSKAHGAYGLYVILSALGYIPKKHWQNFYKGSPLAGCVERNTHYGIEASCGSLGHGLPQAVGIAFGAKLQNHHYRVYCIVGDGELQEGSNWEAIQFSVKHKLNNLTIIIDHNKLQAMDFLHNILTPSHHKNDLQQKFKGFGLLTKRCNGHNIKAVRNVLHAWSKNNLQTPQVLIADTIKGYGLTCMENIPKFHFRVPTEAELNLGKRYE